MQDEVEGVCRLLTCTPIGTLRGFLCSAALMQPKARCPRALKDPKGHVQFSNECPAFCPRFLNHVLRLAKSSGNTNALKSR